MTGPAPVKVLVVDDHPINLKLLRLTLEVEGYAVRMAVDAEQALVTLATFRPRLILMDLQLPGMDGLDLTRLLKSTGIDAIIVAVTAYAMKGDGERARVAGCDGYITKPIDTRTVGATVAHYLDGGR